MPPLSLVARALLFVGLHFVEQSIETLEILLPDFAVTLQPTIGVGERFRHQARRTPLRVAATGDQAGSFEYAQMLGNRGLSHVERLGQHERIARLLQNPAGLA